MHWLFAGIKKNCFIVWTQQQLQLFARDQHFANAWLFSMWGWHSQIMGSVLMRESLSIILPCINTQILKFKW